MYYCSVTDLMHLGLKSSQPLDPSLAAQGDEKGPDEACTEDPQEACSLQCRRETGK